MAWMLDSGRQGLMTVASRFLAIVGLLLATGGCGRPGDQPELAPVRGVVLMDGKPLAGKQVVFAPEGGRPSTGLTDEDGRFELRYTAQIKGAIIGPHTVTISTPLVPGVPPNETIPRKYNLESELTAEVEDTSNEFVFELFSE